MTIGATGAWYDLDGSVEFLGFNSTATSIRDRADGGVNIGVSDENATRIKYGDTPLLTIDNFMCCGPEYDVLVTESEFVVITQELTPELGVAFFPDAVFPSGDTTERLDVLFPSLAGLDIQQVTDITSVDGRLSFLVTGDDGLWLFSTADPSLVPEPTACVLVIMAMVCCLRSRRIR